MWKPTIGVLYESPELRQEQLIVFWNRRRALELVPTSVFSHLWSSFPERNDQIYYLANFSDYPGDFRLQSGDSEKWFKIWTLREGRQPCKLSLYYTLIYTYLSYCYIVWSSTYNTHLDRIFILQKSAIHALSKSEYHAHTVPLFVKPKSLHTYGVFMFHVAKFMFCFHHHLMLPSSFLSGRLGGAVYCGHVVSKGVGELGFLAI